MPKMPFISDTRYSNAHEQQFKVHEQIKKDVSITYIATYPQEHAINLPRHRMSRAL